MKLPAERNLIALAGIAASGMALVSLLSAAAPARRSGSPLAPRRIRASRAATVKTARELNRAAGTLAASVRADSSGEH